MLLTVKDLSQQLQVKPSTIYAWAKQGKIPCKWLHKLLQFEPDQIHAWLAACPGAPQGRPLFTLPKKQTDIDAVIEAAKREVYTPAHGETRPKSGLIRKGEQDGAI